MQQSTPNRVRSEIQTQFNHAMAMSGMGLVFLAIFVTVSDARLPGLWRVMPAAAGVFLMAYGRSQFREVRRRKHGLSVEFLAIERALKILPRYGFAASSSVATRFGDIDLLVGHGTDQLPVEIKSFQSWDGRSDRDRKALEQVAKMRGHLHSRRGYLWLPCAKVGIWRAWFGTNEGATTIVYGDAKRLARILRRQEA